MKKLILRFASLEELVTFSRLLPGGYLMNTTSLTLACSLSAAQLKQALLVYRVDIVHAETAVSKEEYGIIQ
jgi:hypothetical protein